ncbi:MAG: hypothetical protein LWY06_05305 [Firmicutes bacterium]|nr:hypothetical protein [Bacillota bacterium]
MNSDNQKSTIPERDQIYTTLRRFFQNRIHPYHRHFRQTAHYKRLYALQQFHFSNRYIQQNFLTYLNEALLGYKAVDWTTYDQSGFYFCILLLENMTENEADRLFFQKGMKVGLLKIFISFIGQYYFHYKFESRIVPDDEARLRKRRSIYNENYCETAGKVAAVCDEYWQERGYVMPGRQILSEQVNNLYLDGNHPHSLQVFNYLFAKEECIKTPGLEEDLLSTEREQQIFSPWSMHRDIYFERNNELENLRRTS